MNDQKITSKNSVATSLGWKLMERFGVQGMQFVLQIILARLLDPEHYGVLALMIIFVNLANIFIQTGFNTALVQNKDVIEEDYSSVFWVTFGIAVFLYGVVFFAAPIICSFYKMPNIVWPLRVLALLLLPGALNSVQLAKVSRELEFRKVFISSVISVSTSGIAGIVVALLNGGIWALVVQTMLNVFISATVMLFIVRWKPRLICRWGRIKVLFSFGWKLLVSGLLDTLYMDFESLVIGKKYDNSTLGFYNRGKQFPQFLTSSVGGAVQSVMLPVMSRQQDNPEQIKKITRNSISISAYLLFPVMAGLAGVSTPFITLLLTEKWLASVPYLQIWCFSFAFYPVNVCNLQAINAMGRSDIFLKLELIKKGIGVASILFAVFCFDTPVAIACIGVLNVLISCFINAYPNKKLIGYSYFEQIKDIFPSLFVSIVMFGMVFLAGLLNLPTILLLLIQIIVGIVVYAVLSALLHLMPFRMLLDLLKSKILKRKKVKCNKQKNE